MLDQADKGLATMIAIVCGALLLLIVLIVCVNLPDWALERTLIAECQRAGGIRQSDGGVAWKGGCFRVTYTPIATDSAKRP